MPRYYFNVYYGRPSMDEEGEELPDKHAAWREATSMAGDILRDLDGRFRPGQRWKLEVTNEQGSTIYTIHIRADQSSDKAAN